MLDINSLLYTPVTHDDERDYYIYCEITGERIADVLIYELYAPPAATTHTTLTGLLYGEARPSIDILNNNGNIVHFIVDFLHTLDIAMSESSLWLGDKLFITPDLDDEVTKTFDTPIKPVKVTLSKPLLEFYLQTYRLHKLST